MDLLSQHEAFLRAIFDNADDDTPRLVYADFLQENGEEHRADFLRVQCERLRLGPDADPMHRARLDARNETLWRIVAPDSPAMNYGVYPPHRGLWCDRACIEITVEALADPVAFRERVVREQPAWFGATRLDVCRGALLLADHIPTLFSLPFVPQATDWDLSGHLVETPGDEPLEPWTHIPEFSVPLDYRPAMTNGAVDALSRHRGACRIVSLDLRNNDLDNDSARSLVRSPYLDHLKRLQLLDGNRLRGKVWQQVIERFGNEVVG
jgi:uncharacterized protein (TIGR02996 family)